MHLNGLGTPESCEIAIKFFKTVAERGEWALDLRAAHRAFLHGRAHTALLKYLRAAEEGQEVAQTNVAWLLDQGHGRLEGQFELSHRTTLHYLRHAAQQGSEAAHLMLGDYLYNGWGAEEPDYVEAARHYRVAADSNNAQAMFNLGFLHEHGIGLERDLHLAKRMYDQAEATAAEAFVPARLALIGLALRAYLERHHPQLHVWLAPYITPDAARIYMRQVLARTSSGMAAAATASRPAAIAASLAQPPGGRAASAPTGTPAAPSTSAPASAEPVGAGSSEALQGIVAWAREKAAISSKWLSTQLRTAQRLCQHVLGIGLDDALILGLAALLALLVYIRSQQQARAPRQAARPIQQ
jgi:TPR repeat protein